MIEFKAECGHTVRARDEDAGGVVRCSYCGRNAGVPQNASSDLDFLFNEVQQTADPESGGRRRKRRREKPLFAQGRNHSGEFNVFAVVARLCYAAALIIIVFVVAKKFVIPMFDPQKQARMVKGDSSTAPPTKREEIPSKTQGRTRGPGLIRDTRVTGLYVGSTPAGATVYCLEESKAPSTGRIHQIKGGCTPFRTPGEFPNPADGTYIVEIALPWSEPTLKSYPNYFEFRKQLQSGTNEQRRQLVNDYFLPDEMTAVFVDLNEEPPQIVRQYRASVRQGQSKGVRALFLPKSRGKDAGLLGIEELVSNYLPPGKEYEFDQANIRDELGIYGVSEADQRWVVEALLRVGVIPYTTPDRRMRLFKIGIHDGVFATRVIREVSE